VGFVCRFFRCGPYMPQHHMTPGDCPCSQKWEHLFCWPLEHLFHVVNLSAPALGGDPLSCSSTFLFWFYYSHPTVYNIMIVAGMGWSGPNSLPAFAFESEFSDTDPSIFKRGDRVCLARWLSLLVWGPPYVRGPGQSVTTRGLFSPRS